MVFLNAYRRRLLKPYLLLLTFSESNLYKSELTDSITHHLLVNCFQLLFRQFLYLSCHQVIKLGNMNWPSLLLLSQRDGKNGEMVHRELRRKDNSESAMPIMRSSEICLQMVTEPLQGLLQSIIWEVFLNKNKQTN